MIDDKYPKKLVFPSHNIVFTDPYNYTFEWKEDAKK
jgi:hypothetical protein